MRLKRRGLLALSILLSLNSCRRKEGCLYEAAANYCSDCNKANNEVCEYEFTVGFWFDGNFARLLAQQQIDTLYLRLSYALPEGGTKELWQSFYSRTDTFTFEPRCNAQNVKKYTLRYSLGAMPHSCSGGNAFGGGTRCWILQYSAYSPGQGEVRGGSITVRLGQTGCEMVRLQ
ncbi:MAG: hypothetical protein NZ958_05625 [Bacteroidia bacterium]|nr:hypothetical protein [Bacteroidia bacterium]MDW8088940.1 hypothetical protein [Bacteroidia bacterium]